MTKAAELAKMGEVLTNSQIGGRRNIIINGAMQVAQRGTSASSIQSGGYRTVDRFYFGTNGRDEGVYTNAQVSDAPSGFSSSFKVTTTTAESAIDANDLVWVAQRIEAQDLQQLKNGSSDAEKVTLSFYVKSSITGTFGVNLYKAQNTGRIINATYSISSADTWEQKVITFDGDTSGGGIDNNNGEGLRVVWHLASGSDFDSVNSTSWANYSTTNWAGGHAQDGVITTTNATWQLTGVQLEVGDFPNGTPFEHRSFGEELALCQRYCFDMNPPTGASPRTPYIMPAAVYNNTLTIGYASFPVEMRTTPTVTLTGDSGDFSYYEGNQNRPCTAFGVNGMTNTGGGINWTCGGGGMTTGNAGNIYIENDERCIMDAEL